MRRLTTLHSEGALVVVIGGDHAAIVDEERTTPAESPALWIGRLSLAFRYQTEPHAPFPELPGADVLQVI